MTQVFIGGSRHLRRLAPEVEARLDRIVERGLAVLIGDAPGADRAVQAHLHARGHTPVAIFCAGMTCRNNLGVATVHIVHVGKSGITAPALWALALEEDRIVVTINAGDFLTLAKESELHPGVVVLRSQGLTREEQWAWIKPVFESLLESGTELVNQVVEVTGPGRSTTRTMPDG